MRIPGSDVSSKTESLAMADENVFLFAPNLLGYVRVGLALLALGMAFQSWPSMCVCYFLSQVLDVADGYVARRYDQDQVTDRLSTVGILLLNCVVLPQYYYVFAAVLILDLGGHWVHTFASMLAGSESHKKIPTTWPLLRLYYENKFLMFVCHASNEFVWTSLFVLRVASSSSPVIPLIKWLLVPTGVFCILKNELKYSHVLTANSDAHIIPKRPVTAATISETKLR